MKSSIFSKFSFKRPSLERKILLWGFALPLAFDYKKFEEATDSFTYTEILIGFKPQVILVMIAVFFGALYIFIEMQSKKNRAYRSSINKIMITWWIYICLSPLPVLIWEVELDHYLKILLPFALFGVSLSVSSAVERRMLDPFAIITILVWASLIGTTWRFFYTIYLSGLEVDNLRWQILSPGTPLLLGFGIAGIYYRKRLFLSFLSLSVGMGVSMLSVTRTTLISIACVVFTLIIIEFKRKSLASVFRKALNPRLVFPALLIITLSVAAVSYFRPNILKSWSKRFSVEQKSTSGRDITMITRLAEYKGLWEGLTQNSTTLIIGNGLGAYYHWDADMIEDLPLVSKGEYQWFPGHSTWFYMFFASGIILGNIMPVLLILGLKFGYSGAKFRVGKPASESNAIITLSIFAAYIGSSLTGNIFNERYAALIFALVLGMLFIYGNRAISTGKLLRKGFIPSKIKTA